MERIFVVLTYLAALISGTTLLSSKENEGLPAQQQQQPIVLRSPDSELTAVATFLTEKIEEEILLAKQQQREPDYRELTYYRFFTSYAIPERLWESAEQALSYTVNSVAFYKSSGKIKAVKRLNDTIHFIDMRDYGWSPKQWELISLVDPYFSEPLVDHRIYNYGRLVAGNVIFRTDWFIVNATDVTKQNDRGIKDIIYYILLYGQDKIPKNADEFRDIWRVDLETIRVEQVERGTVVDEGHSGVSRHARQLRRGRTVFGYYWETRDVKSYETKLQNAAAKQGEKFVLKDFIEDIFAKNFDAQEFIVSHKNRLQVYQLGDAVGKRVEDADPGVVWDRTDANDVRVRTAKGCMVCHAIGINPASNDIAEIFKRGGKINVKSKELRDAIEAFYLSDLNSDIEDDNRLYARAIKECNGLTPEDNIKAYEEIYNWYVGFVTPEQAALECGMTYRDFKAAIRPLSVGRLNQLFYGIKVPRSSWDSLNAGGYINAMLLIKKIDIEKTARKIATQTKVEKQVVVTTKQLQIAPLQYQQAPELGMQAGIILEVPEDAQVYIEGEKFKQTGIRRKFLSPPLTNLSGTAYYEVKINYKGVAIRRNVSVLPGNYVIVRLIQ